LVVKGVDKLNTTKWLKGLTSCFLVTTLIFAWLWWTYECVPCPEVKEVQVIKEVEVEKYIYLPFKSSLLAPFSFCKISESSETLPTQVTPVKKKIQAASDNPKPTNTDSHVKENPLQKRKGPRQHPVYTGCDFWVVIE
jgi:hypothetical protein